MTLTITIDGVDVTDKVRLEDMQLEMCAIQGQVGSGRITIDDTTGTANLAPAAKEWSAVESDATPTTIAGGFVAERRIDRGPLRAGVQRQYQPVLEDWNTVFTDRVFSGALSKRPAETDYQRIQWLLTMSTMGMIDGVGHIPNDATVDMPKTNYLGKTPLDVLDDCAEASNKNYYLYYKGGTGWCLYYDVVASTEAAFTSTLKISDDPADVDSSTVFAPSAVTWEQDPERVYSNIFVQYDGGQLSRTDADTETTFRRLQRSVVKKNFKTATRARTWADNQLSKLNEETKRLDLTVSVPGSALGELRAGMRIQVKLRSRGVTAYTYFRIASVTFSYRKGDRGESDVMYDVRLKMRDKIRPVNLDDDFGGGDSSGNPGTGSTPIGGGGSGGTSDITPYPVDDFNRTSGDPLNENAASAHYISTPPYEFTLDIPDGAEVVGRYVFIVAAWNPTTTDVASAMVTAGWTKLLSTNTVNGGYASNWFYRKTDGSEGYTGTSDTQTITFPAGAAAMMFSNLFETVYDDGSGPAYQVNPGTTADPDSLPADSYGAEPCRIYTAVVSDDPITGDPVGFTYYAFGNIGSSMYMRASRVDTINDAVDPSTYTTTGAQVSWTLRIRGGGSGSFDEWGYTPTGGDAPWEGGNAWDTSGTDASFSTVGGYGLITFTADGGVGTATLSSDAADDPSTEPWGPWADGDAEFLIRWKTSDLGNLSDTDPNVIVLNVTTGESRNNLRINLGDAVSWSYMDPDQQRGIVLSSGSSTYSTFIPKTLEADTLYYTRFDFSGAELKGKLWKATDPEPILWDVTMAKVAETLSATSTTSIIAYGNDTMVYSFDSIYATLAGSGVTTLPPGDGASVTWNIEPWTPGSLKVFVDGIQVIPASFDREAGTFTFDRAPDLGAVIRVEYIPA